MVLRQGLFHFSSVSHNTKTGRIPVTTSPQQTCPSACSLRTSCQCYATSGPLSLHWKAVSSEQRGVSYVTLLEYIHHLPDHTFWRHNQAGDLCGSENYIDPIALHQLIVANSGKSGYTYTHYPISRKLYSQELCDWNYSQILSACLSGFTINISVDSLYDLDQIYPDCIHLPITVIVPHTVTESVMYSQAGHRITICPASYSSLTCSECCLCAKYPRSAIVGFPAHGIHKKSFV